MATQFTACGNPDDDFDLDVAQAALTGAELRFTEFKFASTGNLFPDASFRDFNFATDFPNVGFSNVGQFKFDSGQYRFDGTSKVILGPKALPDNLILPPPNATFKGGVFQVPGFKSVTSKQVGLLYGLAKANNSEKSVSKTMIKVWGSDFGLTRPKLVKGVIGFGGYSYGGKDVSGLTVPPGYGVAGADRSAYGAVLKGRPLSPDRKLGWEKFLFSWGKTLSNKEKYLAKTEKALGGNKALANKIWKSESKARLKEVKGYLLVLNPPGAAPPSQVYNLTSPRGTVYFTLSGDVKTNLTVVTGNSPLDAKIELSRGRLIRDLQQMSADNNTAMNWALLASFVGVAVASGTTGGIAGLSAAFTAAYTVGQISLAQARQLSDRSEEYLDGVNTLLLEAGYGVVVPSNVQQL